MEAERILEIKEREDKEVEEMFRKVASSLFFFFFWYLVDRIHVRSDARPS